MFASFLKRGAKIGIIFDTANIWRNILLKSALFFILFNSYIVLVEELPGVFDEDIQMVTCSFRELCNRCGIYRIKHIIFFFGEIGTCCPYQIIFATLYSNLWGGRCCGVFF